MNIREVPLQAMLASSVKEQTATQLDQHSTLVTEIVEVTAHKLSLKDEVKKRLID